MGVFVMSKFTSSIKRIFAALLLAGSVVASPAAHAGIPTLDAANLAQAIIEVLSWGEQYGQMIEQIQQLEQQYNQAVQQYDALTGSRGLGDILNNQTLQGVVPANLASTYRGRFRKRKKSYAKTRRTGVAA